MATFLFRCPNTGYRVQGRVADDGSEDTEETYKTVSCHACQQGQPEHQKGLGGCRRLVAFRRRAAVIVLPVFLNSLQ